MIMWEKIWWLPGQMISTGTVCVRLHGFFPERFQEFLSVSLAFFWSTTVFFLKIEFWNQTKNRNNCASNFTAILLQNVIFDLGFNLYMDNKDKWMYRFYKEQNQLISVHNMYQAAPPPLALSESKSQSTSQASLAVKILVINHRPLSDWFGKCNQLEKFVRNEKAGGDHPYFATVYKMKNSHCRQEYFSG